MRIRSLVIALALGLSAAPALATTSITPKASGSAFTLDICLDSVTGNIRQCVYLLDPTTALPVAPIGGTSAGVDPASGSILGVQGITGNMISGTANTTGTATTSIIPLVTSNRLYITAFSCDNTGATTSLISFQDGSGGTTLWTTIVPAGGGSNSPQGTPALFKTTAGNALFFIAASASTTIHCSAAGYSGS